MKRAVVGPALTLAPALALALALLAGCGPQSQVADPRDGSSRGPRTAVPTGMPTAVPPPTGPVTGRGLVLDAAGAPKLCVGGVAESLPPQCDSIPLVGWDWSPWRGRFDQAQGARWGDFTVTGSFDGDALTVRRVVAGVEPVPGDSQPDLTTRCPEPQGGWRVVDPERTDEAALNRVFQVAAGLDGYSGAWMDQSPNPVDPDDPGTDPAVVERAMNDPRLLIVNVQVTGEPAVAERALREVWGGMLCVTRAAYTEAELQEIQREVGSLPGMLVSSSGFDRVDVQVLWDDGTLQAWADTAYGAGVVQVSSALRPAAE